MRACAKPLRVACAEKEGTGKMDKQLQENMPIYMQIMQKVREAIASGELAPGARVASVRELAGAFAVNPNTMQRALAELERDGLVYTQRTSGRFITEDTELIRQAKDSLAMEQIKEFFQKMNALGYDTAQTIALVEAAAKEVI